MTDSTVLNNFKQTPGPQGADDNELILDGTVTQGASGVITSAGDNVHNGSETFNGVLIQGAASVGTLAGDNAFSGANSHSGTETFDGPMENTGGGNLKTKVLNVKMTDISTAKSVWVVPGFACTILKISSVIDGAIITVDAGITSEIGGTPVTGGDLTIAFTGSAAGVVDQNTPTAANAVAANEAVEIISDGLSTNAVDAVFTLEVLPT